ncbi:alpha/beta hydrolase family protein [Rhodalgimonas zhirmunskyi]|uniref:Alpha/beta hydrolase n=1 Tax=Rhodalgimonas zhirmunskyi TaxID=2964767 RepID=A0AAJ1U977_9RHOB|nr:alpha/beta hydrolase [Rhodoalgimonas zhirmunskyi]MDQ2095920.1 alpha/beta hydrolase [Rhodoalgimonas zhirmunskyi]
MSDEITIEAQGARLSGRFFRAEVPRAVAVLNPATGVPQGYYRHFARWLADQGVSTLTYDYRDFGESGQDAVRHSRATMADWGIHDQQAARDWLACESDLPLWVIGHSLGGFMLGYQDGLERIVRVIAICSGPIHVGDHPWPYQAGARALWFGIGPVLLATTGYVPGRFSGLGADIPGPVFRQWKHWCTTKGFHHADDSLPPWDSSTLGAELRTVGVADDEMIPAWVVEKLGDLYPQAAQEHVVLNPAAHGLGKVGHLAGFARRNAALWPDLIGE